VLKTLFFIETPDADEGTTTLYVKSLACRIARPPVGRLTTLIPPEAQVRRSTAAGKRWNLPIVIAGGSKL
jgi:hypothetical protein